MGYLKSIGTSIIYIGAFLAVITFLPGLPPDAEFYEYSIAAVRDIDFKDRLNGAERVYQNQVVGAESFDSYNGELYSAIYGGYVVKLEENYVTLIVKFGEKCDNIWQEQKCGRPLGLKFDKKGNLYVADAYFGIFKVNVATKEYINIVNVSKPIDGKVPRIPNSVDVAENGDIYWTDSSTEFHLYDGTYTLLANPSGRLLRYNVASGKNEVLISNLGFANGVKLSDDESFVIVCETITSRIMKYNLKGPKAGQQEIFIDGLPGLPDNIHSDGRGGFFVSTFLAIDPGHPHLAQSLAPHPYLRKMVARLFALIEAPFKLLQDVYPNIYAEQIVHWVGSFHSTLFLDTLKRSYVLRIDTSGKIIEALFASDNTVFSISSAYAHNDYLWLGSPWLEYVIKVPLQQSFPDLVDNKNSFAKKEKQPLKATASNAKSEKVEENGDATMKPIQSKPTTPKPTTSKPPTVPKTSAKPDKSVNTENNSGSSINKPTPKLNSDAKNDATVVNNEKSKINSQNEKPETKGNKIKENVNKNVESEKYAKTEQDASAKQKAQKSNK